MRQVVLQHHPSENAAVLGRFLQAYGHRLHTVRLDEGQALPDLDDVSGLLIMGGPMNVDETGAHPWLEDEQAFIRSAHEAALPMVGICLGAQLIAAALGGEVAAMETPEVGFESVRLGFPGTIDTLLAGVPWQTMQFHLHGQQVTGLPAGATPLAGSAACANQAFKVGMTTYAFQFHFEWDRDDIERFGRDELVTKAGASPESIVAQCADHYDRYRHLGDRLCENLASLLYLEA
ncbi:MAG: hypothetical protein CMJ18_04575 [Phycisphaeraceae bacterium]|nr:hypothetical protein [Phycisphaeraceae bacterium]